MENIHRPERQPGESQLAYRHRQRVSKAIAGHGMLVSKKAQASPTRRVRREIVEKVGIRQLKKLIRANRGARNGQ